MAPLLTNDPAPISGLLLFATAYLLGVQRLRVRRVRWPAHRSALFLLGLAIIGVAILSPISPEDERFDIHTLQHLLLGMAAPICLMLSAPLTLLLRTLPPPSRAPLARLLHSRLLRLIAHPVTTAALAVGSLYALYFSGLYQASLDHPTLHELVHLHFIVAGYLFSWSIAGIDPIFRRPSVAVRGAVLIIAMAAHCTLAKLLYIHGPLVAAASGVSLPERKAAGLIMWYGADAIDLVLLLLFFAQWYLAGGRKLRRQRTATTPRRPPPKWNEWSVPAPASGSRT
jgi:putative membrane protein